MREEKENKEDLAFKLDKERKVRDTLQSENEELRVQVNQMDRYFTSQEHRIKIVEEQNAQYLEQFDGMQEKITNLDMYSQIKDNQCDHLINLVEGTYLKEI